MNKLKFYIPFILVIITCIYSYLWLSTAENIRAAIDKEVEQAKELGIIVEIEDYKYSSFPFAVSITPQNSKLTLNNSINGKSYLIKIPDVLISCDIMIKNCDTVIGAEGKIEVLEKEEKKPLYEIKFINGLKAFANFSKSYLIAYLVEKDVKREDLVEQFGFESPEIVINNLATNQEVSNVKNLTLNETLNQKNNNLPLSSVKFGFEMNNVPSTSFYLSDAFSKFAINANVDNFFLQKDETNKSMEVKINKLACILDQSSLETKGKVTLGKNNLPQSLDLNFTINNYDYLIRKALLFSYQGNLAKEKEQFLLIQKIVEKITSAPYGNEQATFTVTASEVNPSNVMIGNASINEILQMTLSQYNRNKK